MSIRKQSVETKARQVAARHGLTMTDAIERALDNELARDEARKEAEFQEAMRIVRAANEAYLAAGDNGLTEQDVMGWDENGLPT